MSLFLAGLALLAGVSGLPADTCHPPCDLYEIDYNFDGTFTADESGPYPKVGPWVFPCDPAGWPRGNPANGVDCAASVGAPAEPRVFKTAWRIHNAAGWSPVKVQAELVTQPDVNPYADWVEELYRIGVTGGCGPGRYCPSDAVSRDKMAVFLLKAMAYAAQHPEHFPPGWTPPPCTGVFADTRCSHVTYPPTVWPTPTQTPPPPTAAPPTATRTRTPAFTPSRTPSRTRTPSPGGPATRTPSRTPTFDPCSVTPCGTRTPAP